MQAVSDLLSYLELESDFIALCLLGLISFISIISFARVSYVVLINIRSFVRLVVSGFGDGIRFCFCLGKGSLFDLKRVRCLNYLLDRFMNLSYLIKFRIRFRIRLWIKFILINDVGIFNLFHNISCRN